MLACLLTVLRDDRIQHVFILNLAWPCVSNLATTPSGCHAVYGEHFTIEKVT